MRSVHVYVYTYICVFVYVYTYMYTCPVYSIQYTATQAEEEARDEAENYLEIPTTETAIW